MHTHQKYNSLWCRGNYWLVFIYLVFSSSMVQARSILPDDIFKSSDVKHVFDFVKSQGLTEKQDVFLECDGFRHEFYFTNYLV